MRAEQIFNFILKPYCTDDFSRQVARRFPRRLKSSVRDRLKICLAPNYILYYGSRVFLIKYYKIILIIFFIF